jgi:hypothetical protein
MLEIRIRDMRTRGRVQRGSQPPQRRAEPVPIADVLPSYVEELRRRCDHTRLDPRPHAQSNQASASGALRR